MAEIASGEMIEGYLDGIKDSREDLPDGTNRSAAYVHGWRNGRDDRLLRPRAPAQQLRMVANAILRSSCRHEE